MTQWPLAAGFLRQRRELNLQNNLTNMLSKGMTHQFEQINSLPIITLFLHEAKLDPEVQEIFSQMMTSVRKSAANLLLKIEQEEKIRKGTHDTMALLMSLIGIGYMTLYETGDNGLTTVPVKTLTDDFANILVNGIIPSEQSV